jgi:hypothetical protein
MDLDKDFVENFYRENYSNLISYSELRGANGFSKDAVQDLELFLLTKGNNFSGNKKKFKSLVLGYLEGRIETYKDLFRGVHLEELPDEKRDYYSEGLF